MWIYYSSIILYFGEEFTKAYAVEFDAAIHPNDYAVITKQVEVEEENRSVQQAEKGKEKEKELVKEKEKEKEIQQEKNNSKS